MTENRRILVVDDTKTIHDDFQKILCSGMPTQSSLASARAACFGNAEDGAEEALPDEEEIPILRQ